MRFENIEAKTLKKDLEKINIVSTVIDDFTIEIDIVDTTPIQALIDMYTYVQPLPIPKPELEIIRDTQSQIVLSLVMGGLM